MGDWATKYNPFASKSKYEEIKQETLTYANKGHVTESHGCTDPFCGFIFILCLAATGYITYYAFQKGDPRKIYHGMDWEGHLCGVDLYNKPYVYWCQKEPGSNAADAQGITPGLNTPELMRSSVIDFHHPICVEYCPMSTSTKSLCYDSDTNTNQVTSDYATHAVAHRYCLPQSGKLMRQFNEKMDAHAIQKYVPIVISTVREGGWLFLGVFFLAFILSMTYMMVIQCLANILIWFTVFCMVTIPFVLGCYLLYIQQHGGMDGMPNSDDSGTDEYMGWILITASMFFLFVYCCMSKAIGTAIKVVETSAECLTECWSLLLEPLVNLAARICVWVVMLAGLAWLVSCGDVQKSKVYRTFTYTSSETVYLIFFVMMFIWVNDFLTACSQYTIANAASKWYFTEIKHKQKSVPSCLLCQGYCNIIPHFGSLAFGSFIIAFCRPVRYVLSILVFAEEATDNATCGCITRSCSCVVFCFESLLQHISKSAFIDMAITGKPFCAAGADAAEVLFNQNKAKGGGITVHVGATWLFSLTGLGTITAFGAMLTGFVVINFETFNSPSSQYYVQDPMVFVVLSGILCFIVGLGFMVVFDSIADSLFLCNAKELEAFSAWKSGNMSSFKAPKVEKQTGFSSFFKTEERAWKAPTVNRPQYAHDSFQKLVGKDQWK